MTTAAKLVIVKKALRRANLTNITIHGVRQLLRDEAQLSAGEIFLIWQTISETRRQMAEQQCWGTKE